MAPSSQGHLSRESMILPPDGRQTRIDFFSNTRAAKSDFHVLTTRKSTFDWWNAIKGWMKSEKVDLQSRTDGFEKFLRARNYSVKTCKSYLFMMRKFFNYLEERQISQMGSGIIEDYNYEFFVSGRYSRSYQLQFINALTLYFEFSENVKVNLKGLQRSGIRKVR